MKMSDIENARAAVRNLADKSESDSSKIEILLDTLAKALVSLCKSRPASNNLEDILTAFDADKDLKKKLKEILEEMQGAIESEGYGDEDDEEDEGTLSLLIEDFTDYLEAALSNLKDEHEE